MTPSTGESFYADPAIYDILYSPDTWREVDALERVERRIARETGRSLRGDRLWFEPACGSGRYLRVAARRGRRTAGYDLDERMISYAAGRKLPAGATPTKLFRADMTDCLDDARSAGVRAGTVDFAFNPVNSIRHLQSDRALLAHLDQTAALLKPGGLYVVGLSLTDYGNAIEEEDLWTAARGGCRVTQLVNYLPPEPGTKRARSERVISHLTVERPGRTEHLDHTYDLRTYDEDQWRAIVGKSRLQSVASCDAHGRPAPSIPLPYRLEVLATRR